MTRHKLTVKNLLTRGARLITWARVFLAVAVQARGEAIDGKGEAVV